MKLKINKNITNKLSQIKEIYQSSQPVDDDDFTVVTEPFKLLKLHEVITDSKYIEDLKSASTSVPMYEKNNDLYSLQQSGSLFESDNACVREFIRFLKRSIQPVLESVCGYQFNDTVSVTTSVYKQGDVLLCHDDKCEDRCVAFVYYLTSLSDDSGGTLDLFQHNPDTGQPSRIIRSIPAVRNSLICFEVGNYTYHQVSEVTSSCEERISINGWFHHEKALSIVPIRYIDPLPTIQHQVLLEGLVMLEEFVNIVHFTPSYIDQVRESFSNESTVLLSNFMSKLFLDISVSSLQTSGIKWTKAGPANRRKYEVGDLKSVKGGIGTLLSFMKSSLFVSYLKSITGLDIEPLAGNEIGSKLVLELQRWSSGCYTMATDNDEFFKHDGLDVYFFFKVSNYDSSVGGTVTYLDSGDEQDSDSQDNELLTIEPADNSLCAVYRTSDTVRFTKYINSHFKDTYYCIAATYYEINDKLS